MVVKIGTFGNDLLLGTAAADLLNGKGGNDVLLGGYGDDEVLGAAGNDILNGGAGDDQLVGGIGNDTAVFETTADLVISLRYGYASSITLGEDTLSRIENIVSGDGDDVIVGSDYANIVQGGDGNDYIYAGDGADSIYGGDGADELGGYLGNDFISGGSGGDFINGEEGDDVIDGGGGADEIFGGDGVDQISGGGGADRFVVQNTDSGVGASSRDVIDDFNQAQGDKIDLHYLDDLQFIGTDTFSAPDQVRFFQSNGDTIIRINTVGNTDAEMEIQLEGIVNLGVGDFIL
jgi:Ca2+-binding RTX toxin-like protein